MKLFSTIAVCAVFSLPAFAQEQMSRDQTYEEIAKAVAQIQATQRLDLAPTGLGTEFYNKLMKETLAAAEALRIKLANNPYVRVKGFRVGVPPNFSFDFEFKD